MLINTSESKFAIYVHIPFCQKKCPYCDFNSYKTSESQLQEKEILYTEAICREILNSVNFYKLAGLECEGIFFGGGTPSLFSGENLKKILDLIKSNFKVSNRTEITLEANPRSIVEGLALDKLSSFLEAGFNRISIGAQSFSSSKLEFLGRWHSGEDTIKTYESALKAGFKNINLDLMFGIKGESFSDWKSDLSTLLSLSPQHISTYMLTMESGTEFGKRHKKGEILVVDEDLFVEMYQFSQAKLTEFGYIQYEVSNFSKPGFECRHNLVYWRGGQYLGVGAGAHGFIKSDDFSGLRYSNTPSPEIYMNRINKDGNAIQRRDEILKKDILLEYICFRMRLAEGIVLSESQEFDQVILDLIHTGKLDNFFDQRLLVFDGKNIKVPLEKFHFIDEIVCEISTLI